MPGNLALYQSALLEQYIQLLAEGATSTVRPGYVLVRVDKAERCHFAFADFGPDEAAVNTSVAPARLVHVEVLDDCGYCNALLYVAPMDNIGFYIGVLDHGDLLQRVPWGQLCAELSGETTPHPYHVLPLTGRGEDPFPMFFWLHSCLWLDNSNGSSPFGLVPTLIRVAQAHDSETRKVPGNALYELHTIDALLPINSEELRAMVARWSTVRMHVLFDSRYTVFRTIEPYREHPSRMRRAQ